MRCTTACVVFGLRRRFRIWNWHPRKRCGRSSLAVYHVGSMVLPALLKSLLLTVVLAMDVRHVSLLVTGAFSALVLLEIIRLIIARWSAGLGPSQRQGFRVAVTLIAAAAGLQVVSRLIAMTPMGSPMLVYLINGFQALGQTASSDVVYWLSFPWMAAAHLAVHDTSALATILSLVIALGSLPLAIIALVHVDQWSQRAIFRREQRRLAEGQFTSGRRWTGEWTPPEPNRWSQSLARWTPAWAAEAIAIMSRQWVSVVRYRGTIAFSFAVPTLLCLSPLATGRQIEQWLFVVGGIAMCTMLLAPPALRIDFRRDLKRILLLRSLPVHPLSMIVGQLALPVLITWCYQWLTLIVAAIVISPGWPQWLMWTAMLNALAVFTFAAENAMFLAYPHHEHAEGLAMMIRAKLTFLGKAIVMAIAAGLLVGWAMWCRASLPPSVMTIVFVTGSLAASWSGAAAALWVAKTCWRRYDLSCDIPPA
jgi:hypothetical protein